MKTFYASTFIDNSISWRGKPTGNHTGYIMTRQFYKGPTGKVKASRGIIPFSWSEDTEEAKAEALQDAIKGMEEMPELDANPPLTWVPNNLKL